MPSFKSLLVHTTLLAAVFAFCDPAHAQVVTPEQQKSAGEVMAAITAWADAVRDRDMKALDRLFADDLVITTYDGGTRGKKEELEVLKPDPNVRTVSVANEDVAVKLFGDVSVVTALAKMQFVLKAKDTAVALRYTAVFVKRDGRWQLVALQSASVPQPASKNSQ